ncbi:MAG TPA: SDR family NAD(P)-dependent oxidoreductase [Pseudolabrys sp.]|nr:SDR family NAD(P)-dependent oxidoreductase [Pseudolabrys sp.]
MVGAYREADIAIVGMSGRFPGADNVDAFWRNLCDGVESVTFFSDEELLAAGVPASLIANPNYVKAAPVLREAGMFDASFFGLSPKEAALMDPQHRLFLEVAWEAIENAGYDPYSYPGKVGVVSACGGVVSSYLLANVAHDEFPGQTAGAVHISNDKDFLSTRVSFKLNLRGPSFTVQSACSSSLLAVHQACQLLRLNECDMMLAGASSVRVPQVQGYVAEKRNLYSLDGHCRPFDAEGQGTIFGSGVGAVLLKPLARAVADRDRIVAVIKGTAANNDGSGKISYTAPSVGQQAQAVADAITAAGTRADRIGYVECHSTGTIVGDPLEIEALSNAFRGEAGTQFCAIGSLKANIGHPEQAAGIAGIIKTALVLQHKQIPPSINFVTPNPRIDFAASPFYVNDRLRDFPQSEGRRQAGLNSLGIGGTNAFAVLEEAPPVTDVPLPLTPVVVLSAKTPGALTARVRQLLDHLDANPDVSIGDVCYTTCLSRGQFAFRFAACARTISDLTRELRTWLDTTGADAARLKRAAKPRLAYMFSGQGPQHAGMAADLYRTRAVFRSAMDESDRLARPYLERGLLEVIFAQDGGEAALVNRTDYTQPALFAVEYALIQLLKSWGVTPNALIGHSLGEIAAACVAGVLSLADAMRLAVARGALMHKVPAGGAMAAVWAPESGIRDLIAAIAPGVTVAAMNGPSNTVLTGDRDELRRLVGELGRRGVNARELRISNGFHSPRTDPILDELEQIAGTLSYAPPRLPLVSNLTGAVMDAAPDAAYWRRHTREPVRFGDGMAAVAALDCQVYLEIGPHPVLLPLAQTCLADKGKPAALVGSLNRQKADVDATAEMLAALYRAGVDIDWAAVQAESGGKRIALPTYPFERKRYWLDEPRRAQPKPVAPEHPLVGVCASGEGNETVYEKRYSLRELGYLADHKVFGQVYLPTTVELEALSAIGRRLLGAEVALEQAMHHQAMTIDAGDDRLVRVTVMPMKSDRFGVRLASRTAGAPGPWTDHMTGTLRRQPAARGEGFDPQEVLKRCPLALPRAEAYARLGKLGLEYGPRFRGIDELHIGAGEVLARVRLQDGVGDDGYAIHPAFLDACLHTYPFAIEDAERTDGACWLPVSLERFSCEATGTHDAWVHARLRPRGDGAAQIVDIRICDAAGDRVAEMQGLKLRLLHLGKRAPPAAGEDDVFYTVTWRQRAKARPAAQAEPGAWVLFADKIGIAAALAQRLAAHGASCHLVRGGEAFHQHDCRTWTIDTRQAEDHRAVLQQIASDERLPVRGVVDLRALDAPTAEDLTPEALAHDCERICSGALGIVHALTAARAAIPSGLRLWFITGATQDASGGARGFNPVQASLWGLGRTAALEYPNIWGGLIDLRPEGDVAPVVDALAAEVLDPDGETQIALAADGARSVARFVRQPLADLPARPPRIRPDATYLIAGGLGMLGVSTARWLIGHGAKHIVLTGRNATSDRLDALFSPEERSAATLHVISADISRADEVRRLFDTIRAGLPPLKGVVHSAGVLDDGVLARQTWDRFAPLFAPRVTGSWLLHEQTKAMELDFFVLNSSLLSVLGSAGQANYTASAAFLDCLAAHRRAVGLPAVAVNWCAWSEGGLATVSGARGQEMWSRLGMKDLAPGPAMDLFDRLMQRDTGQIAIAVADWPVYAGRVGKPAFLSELVEPGEKAAPAKPASRGGADIARLIAPHGDSIVFPSRAPFAAGGEDKRAAIQNLLQRHVMAELGFQEPLDPDRPLNEVGLDSLRSVSLANRLEDEIGIPISVTELISGPSIVELADHVGELLETSVSAGILNVDALPLAAAPVRREEPRSQASPVWGSPADTLGSNGDAHEDHAAAAPVAAPSIIRAAAKWLVSPRPTPRARARLFCFPYAGGGLVTFRSWPQLLGDAIEVVAIEAPGRGTRISEAPVEDMDAFVDRLLPELTSWIDRPAAFFGHCLGGLTMFVAACALPQRNRQLLTHLFACGARPPHLLRAMGEFEDNLVYDMMLHPRFDPRRPAYAQDDEIFAGIIRQFDTSAADEMLAVRRLRDALLPTIRAEFGMASNYVYRPGERFACPITSFVGDKDPWVSEKHSEAWGELTSARFENQLRHGSHFLIAEDRAHIVQTIGAQFAAPVIGGAGAGL